MYDLAFLNSGNDYFQPMILNEPVFIESLFHREARSQQADLAETGCFYLKSGRIGNVKEGNVRMCLDVAGGLVHRIRAQDDKICSATFQGFRRRDR